MRADAPQTDPLVREWCAVLGRDLAHDDDHFFSCGGNSILALRLVTRLRRIGFRITPADVFRHQVLGELRAKLVRSAQQERPKEEPSPGTVAGPVERSPMASWFWEQGFPEPDLYHQSVVVELHRAVDPDQLREYLEKVVERHPALNPRTYGEGDARETVRFVRTECSPEELGGEVEAHRHALSARGGPALLAVYSPAPVQRMVLVAHHLRVDSVSWNLVLDDLDHLLGEQRSEPGPPQDPSLWLSRLRTEVSTDRAEADYWRKAAADPGPALFPAGEGPSRLHWSSRTLLSGDVAEAAERSCGGTLEPLLFTALARALASWRGRDSATVDREVHGRDALDIDASDIVGWLASSHPVRLAHHPDPSRALTGVRETMDALPHNGSRFLAHRFLSPTPVPESPAEVCLTYMGRAPVSGRAFGSFH